jgi:hypothetical protein
MLFRISPSIGVVIFEPLVHDLEISMIGLYTALLLPMPPCTVLPIDIPSYTQHSYTTTPGENAIFKHNHYKQHTTSCSTRRYPR